MRGPGGSTLARSYVRLRPHLPELIQAIMDIGWAGLDVAVNTRRNSPSRFIDLVAGGQRECLGDQPDVYYSAAYLDISRGREYLMRIPPSDAICTHIVMTTHKDGASTQTSWATASPTEARQEHVVRICDAPGAADVLDASPHEGLALIFVRQYFLAPVDETRYEEHEPRLKMTAAGKPTATSAMPVSWTTAVNFLLIRELTITVKFLTFVLGVVRPWNKWQLTNLDRIKGYAGRIKEALIIERGRYLFLNLSITEKDILEVIYQPRPNIWASLAFVSKSTRTLAYMNVCDAKPDADGRIRIRVSVNRPNATNVLGSLSMWTKGRRTGTLLLREVSTDGRNLRQESMETVDAVLT